MEPGSHDAARGGPSDTADAILRELGNVHRALRERWEADELRLAQLQQRLDRARGSLSYRLGAALLQTRVSWAGLRSLGGALHELGREARGRRRMAALRPSPGRVPAAAADSPRARVAGDIARALSRAKGGTELRVLHFSREFSRPSETFTYDVIRGLDALPNVDNHVMFFARELEQERPYAKTIQLHGCTRVELEAATPNLVELVELVLDGLRPQLIHCHFGWAGLPLVRILRQRSVRLPVVITMHGTDVNTWPERHAWYRDALAEAASDPGVWFTTHTETYRGKLAALRVAPQRVEVIPNSFAPTFEEADRPPWCLPGGHLRVICVARMDIWKGHEYLLRGFAQFRQQHYPNASLTLVGEGIRLADMQRLAKELGVARHVRFRGRVAHAEIPLLLQNHDVYVQPSIKHPSTHQEEGQPIAVLEAAASGMPVIVTDTGGLPETVQLGPYAGSAIVVPPCEAAAIASALAELVAAGGASEGRRAYVRTVREKHGQGRQVMHTVKLYRRACSARST